MTETGFSIRAARPDEADDLAALLPRLADFEVPAHRRPEELWQDDEKLLRRWAAGEAAHCIVIAAVDGQGAVVGVSLASFGKDPMNHGPGAHLEALAIAPAADGHGVGKRLLEATEAAVRERGGRSMTLHVFANNVRARHVYDGLGYSGEILRYFKALD